MHLDCVTVAGIKMNNMILRILTLPLILLECSLMATEVPLQSRSTLDKSPGRVPSNDDELGDWLRFPLDRQVSDLRAWGVLCTTFTCPDCHTTCTLPSPSPQRSRTSCRCDPRKFFDWRTGSLFQFLPKTDMVTIVELLVKFATLQRPSDVEQQLGGKVGKATIRRFYNILRIDYLTQHNEKHFKPFGGMIQIPNNHQYPPRTVYAHMPTRRACPPSTSTNVCPFPN